VLISSLREVIIVALLLATLAYNRSLSAQTANTASSLVTAQDTLTYLKNTIDWYHHLRVDEQLATDAADVMFLDDERQLARQIARLSFDFARAEAKLLSSQSNPVAIGDNASDSARYSGLMQAAAAAEKEVRETQAEIESLKQKLQTAQGQSQRQLQSTIDEVQSELNLAQTRSETFRSILQFVNGAGAGAGNLLAQID
jgi:hypothetical protein